jgi:hypothetical protein
MKQIVFILILIWSQNSYCQSNGLKFRNNLTYKAGLVEKEVKGLTERANCPNCNSIRECIFFFDDKMEQKNKQALTKRIKEIANKFIENNQVLILTSGTNGDGGLGMADLDKRTKKYKYIFVTVSMSCLVGDLSDANKIFNTVSIKHLDSKYDERWRKSLSNVLKKKGIKEKI